MHSVQVCHSTYSNYFQVLGLFGVTSDRPLLFVAELSNREYNEPGASIGFDALDKLVWSHEAVG